jgi:ATP-dependent helicase/DNAse subunit B
MNDGSVPAFQTSDMFLHDGLRRKLSIEDNTRRFARDAYALTCLLATRQYDPKRTRFIGSRRSAEGDPMLPSRLFFAADDETVTKRVQFFFAEHREKLPRIQFTFQEKAPLVVFDSPKIPEHAGQAIKEMSVSEFAEYKKCPYRYYLKYHYKLQTLNDEDTELDAGKFGSLIHDVLELFGKTKEMKDSVSAEKIRDFLVWALREKIHRQYGERPRSVVAIQAERARRRLEAFADWQANRALEYEILDTELHFSSDRFSLDVDGKTMGLKGRIDRIDRHKKTNELIIWDYKTGKADDPNKKHRNKDEWIDFQLPLYHHLLSQHPEYSGLLQKGFRLGYILLPPKATDTGSKFADWNLEMVLSAIDEARTIVRHIWNDSFEKTVPPPQYSEAFAAICNVN